MAEDGGFAAAYMTADGLASRHAGEARPEAAWQLWLLDGVHRGARHVLHDNGRLTVGAAADNDVILADPGVAPRHCTIRRWNGEARLKAGDAPLRIDNRRLNPGAECVLRPGQAVYLGQAVLAVAAGEHNGPERPFASRWRDPVSALRRHPLTIAAVLTALVAGAVLLSAPLREKVAPAAATDVPAFVAHALASLHLDDLHLERRGDRWRLHGTVADDAQGQALRKALAPVQHSVQLQLRSGDDVAGDVREVLRLSHVDASARYLGDGRVQVHGHFGDERGLATAVGSRAMKEIDGLRQIVALNMDSMPPPGAAASGAGKIVALVPGSDPYVVTADGSRYYLGARMPQGGRLQAVDDDAIEIRTDSGNRRIDFSDLRDPATAQLSQSARTIQGAVAGGRRRTDRSQPG